MARAVPLLAASVLACGAPTPHAAAPQGSARTVTITIIGTNDLHGHIAPDARGQGGVALLGGYIANVRAARARDGGGVLLLDGGDLFQGTLESNLNEGAAVFAAYSALGYDAAAIGNHEFDFGPPGPRVTAGAEEDPRGALRARCDEVSFPLLTANIIDESTGQPLAGSSHGRIIPSVMREVAGVKFGVVGVATTDTPTSTTVANFRGLRLMPLAEAIDREVVRLRAAGARVIVVASHAGLCRKVDDVESVQHSDSGEIVDVLRQVKERVDVVVAGHTHAGAVLRVGNTVITEAWKYGRGFGRVDVVYDRSRDEVVHLELYQPRFIRSGDTYEGVLVEPDPRVNAVIAPYVAAAAEKRARRLGVRVLSPVRKSYDVESPFGNLSADLMRAARPEADVIVTNGGGLRKDLSTGDLTYGELFEAFPFDNFFARISVRGAELRRIFEANLATERGILTMAGMRLEARCDGARLDVRLLRDDGRLVTDDEQLVMVTSDFLASGGMDGALKSIDPTQVIIEEGNLIREAMIAELSRRGGTIDGGDRALLDPARRRIAFPGRRPVICGSAATH